MEIWTHIKRRTSGNVHLFIFSSLYYFTAYLGTSLFSLQPSNITLIWLPSGIGLVMMMNWGWRALPYIFIASFLFNFPGLFSGKTFISAVIHTLVSSLSDVLSPTLGMILLQRFLRKGPTKAKDLVKFCLYACLLPIMLSSLIISANMVKGGYVDAGEFTNMLRMLFFADSLGILLVYMTYVNWKNSKSIINGPPKWFLYSSLTLVTLILIGIFKLPWFIYLMVPVLIASAFESNQFKVSLLGSTAMLAIIVATAHDLGPFISSSQMETNTNMMAFIFAITLTLFGVSLQNVQLSQQREKQKSLQQEKVLAQQTAIARLHETLALENQYAAQLKADINMATTELSKKNQQLEKLAQQKSLFFTSISHEFRTPLTLIKEPVRKLAAGDYGTINRKGIEAIAISVRNIDRLTRLINELLLLAELEAGVSTLSTQHSDIHQFCKRTLHLFDYVAQEKKITFTSTIPDHPRMLYFDQEKLEKVLSNLLFNAFKYTPTGGKINLSIQHDDTEQSGSGEFITISVTDTGIGIPKGEQVMVFDRFYRSTNSEVEGSGIGLALVKELVELHGGSVTVSNTKSGSGSQFSIHLPMGNDHLLSSEVDRNHRLATHEQAQTAKKSKDKIHTVLVVEDNADMQTFIVQQLDEHVNILQAEDGIDALDKLNKHQVDLVLSDVMMPNMDGLHLLEAIRNSTKLSHLPVILLTAKASDEDRIVALKAKADDILTKPFNSAELTLKVMNLVERSSYCDPTSPNISQAETQGVKVNPENNDKQHENVFLKKVRDCVLANISSTDFDIKCLAHELLMSRSTFQRKVMQECNMTAALFVRNIRLEQAHYYIQNKIHRTLAETAYAVGFNHPGYFSKLYKKYYQS